MISRCGRTPTCMCSSHSMYIIYTIRIPIFSGVANNFVRGWGEGGRSRFEEVSRGGDREKEQNRLPNNIRTAYFV